MSANSIARHRARAAGRTPQGTKLFTQLVRKELRTLRSHLALGGLSMLGVAATELLAPWPLKLILDNVLLAQPLTQAPEWAQAAARTQPTLAIIVISLGILLIAIMRGFFSAIQIYHTSQIGHQISARLQQQLFSHVQRLSLTFHHRSRSGELLAKMTSDTRTIRDVLSDGLLDTAAQFVTLVGMLVVLSSLNWQLSLIVLASFPILAVAVYRSSREVKLSSRSQRKLEGAVAARISESLGAISLVQAFGRERYERERFVEESQLTLEESIRTARIEAAGTRRIEVISAAGTWAVVLFGGLQVLAGTMTPGALLIFATYVASMYRPIRSLAKLSTRFSKAVVSAERISEILATEPEVLDRRTAIPAGKLRGHVTFTNVAFDYGDGSRTLRNISFSAMPGQRVALVGASGAGKSTIANLLLRFYDPRAGYIQIDGVDLRDYQRESLRHQIGVVLQDTILLGTTVRENIAYGKPDATQAEIEAAARLANAHGFVMALPDGYDTLLGERGSTISGGQRQRLSLARALLKRPAVLILDEPTSAVDAESARLIQTTITETLRDTTTIMIAHQFTALDRFDQILVLKDGVIVEHGTHAELLARAGLYYELAQLQGAS
jgi:ATP-binding cassette, subfamily B, bacterial